MYLRDNDNIYMPFQYFPETISINRTRNIDERPLPLRFAPVNFDASANAPTVEFTALFNSFFEDLNRSPLGWQNVILESDWGQTVPAVAINDLNQLWRPDMYEVDHVWVLDLGFPVAPREVLIESYEETHMFYEQNTASPRRTEYTVKARFYYELDDPEREYRQPTVSKKTGPFLCPNPDLDSLEAAIGMSLTPNQRTKVAKALQGG